MIIDGICTCNDFLTNTIDDVHCNITTTSITRPIGMLLYVHKGIVEIQSLQLILQLIYKIKQKNYRTTTIKKKK